MTVKPTRFIWADDDLYAAGGDPWSGQPNKVVPSAGRRAQGYIPEIKPAAANINYILNEIGLQIDRLQSMMMLRNWKQGVLIEPAFTRNVMHGRYLSDVDAFMFIDQDCKVVVSRHYYVFSPSWWGNKGEILAQESDIGTDIGTWVAGTGRADIAEISVLSPIRLAVCNAAIDQVAVTGTFGGPWNLLVSGLSGTYSWERVEIGTNFPTVFGVISGGTGAGAGAIAYASGAQWYETAYTTGDIVALKSNKSMTSHQFVCCSDSGELGTSADGITWSFQTISPAEGIEDFAYSSASGRWIGVNVLGSLWFSDDAGVTWVRHINYLPDFGDMTVRPYGVTIAANDKYCFVVTALGDTLDQGKNMQWASWDDGDTWERIVKEDTHDVEACAAGGGRFVMAGWTASAISLIGDFGPP